MTVGLLDAHPQPVVSPEDPDSPRRVIVSGGRGFARADVVEEALRWSQGDRPPASMTAVHGRCDPRSSTGTLIAWESARRLPRATWRRLAGADWLTDVVACELNWHVDRYPPDRAAHGRGAEVLRNTLMAQLGGDIAHVLLTAFVPNRGSMDCAGKLAQAEIPVWFWCDECGPTWKGEQPCPVHSLGEVASKWAITSGVLR